MTLKHFNLLVHFLLYFLTFKNMLHLLILCMGICVPQHMLEIRGQLVGVDSLTVWISLIELRSSSLAASAFTCWAVCSALCLENSKCTPDDNWNLVIFYFFNYSLIECFSIPERWSNSMVGQTQIPVQPLPRNICSGKQSSGQVFSYSKSKYCKIHPGIASVQGLPC